MTENDVGVLRQCLDALDDVFYLVSPEGEPLVWNDRAAEVTGYSRDEIEGMRPTDFVADDHRQRVAESIQEVLETGDSVVEADIVTKGGGRISYEFNGQRLTDQGGNLVGITGIGRDISGRKEREAEIREQARRLQLFSVAFPDLAFVVDEDGRFLDVVAGEDSRSLLYEDPSAFLHQTVHDVFPGDLADEFVSAIETAIRSGEPQRLEYPLEFPEGELWFEASIESIPFRIDGADATVWVAREITDRKESERKVARQNERLEKFASIVSHDLRNPLNVAGGRLQLVAEECDSQHLAPIATALDRIERIIDDVLWLARTGRDIGTKEPVDLGEAVDASWMIVADDSPDRELVVAETDDGGLRTIEADFDRLCQLLENLFRNAVEHGGDDVTVTVGNLDTGFYVEDDGPGVPEDARADVFEAGYTTSSEGTGFGLNIVKEITDAHGWSIRVNEGRAGGARFEVSGVERPDQ